MSKKKKSSLNLFGFTLVELLVTIAIISLILGIAVYAVNNVINSSKKESHTLAVNNIKKSANTYAQEYTKEISWDTSDSGDESLSETCVSVQTLVSKGYLDKKVLEDGSMPKSIIVTKDKDDTIVSEKEYDYDCTTYSTTVPIPTSSSVCNKRIYNKSGQDLIKANLISTGNYKEIKYKDTNYNSSNLPTNAGDYKVELTLMEEKQWRDNTTESKIVTCTIQKATPKFEFNPSGSDGTSQGLGTVEVVLTSEVAGTITLKSSNKDYAKATADDNKINANENKTIKITNIATRDTATYITATLKSEDPNYEDTQAKYTIEKIGQKTTTKPTSTICNNLTYNGNTQNLATESEGYKLYNNTAVNYGTYTVTAKLNYGYSWEDNSTEPVEFTCEIKRPTPTITYKDATCNPATKTVNYDDKYGDLCSPTKTGYTFLGWYTDTNYSNSVTKDTIVSNFINHDLYAKWEVNYYTVTLNTSKGISSVSGAGKYKYGDSVKIDATVSPGYTWSKWTGSHSTTTKSYTFTMPASDITDSASATPNNYIVKYNSNGGTCTMDNSSHTYDVAKNLSASNCTKIGYKFSSWNTKADGSGTSYTDQQSVMNLTTTNNGTVTLYAQWTPYKVIINYNVNGGTIESTTTTPTTPVESVHTWTVDSNGTIYKSTNGGPATASWHSINYGTELTSSGLADWNNYTWMDITNGDLIGKYSAQWICLDGDCEVGKTYDQLEVYAASDFCDASYGDCTVVLGVNWIDPIYRVSTQEGGDGISVKCFTDSLEEAIYYADETEYNTIRMLKSTEEAGNINFNKSLIFRAGSGKTLTLTEGPLIIDENATVTKLSGGTITGTGAIRTIDVYGKLIVGDGYITSEKSTAIYTNANSQLEITGGTISASTESSGYWAIRNQSSYKVEDTDTTDSTVPCRDEGKCAVIVSGGTLNGNGGGIYSDTNGDILVSGGIFNSTNNYELSNAGTGTFYVTSGTIGSASDNKGAISNSKAGRIDISGGTITCGSVVCARNSGTGVLRMLHGTLTSANTGLYNSSTGKLVVGLTGEAAIINGTGSGTATVYCGSSSTEGSHAICHVNSATISASNGYAVVNNGGTYRQYAGSTVTSSSASHATIYNKSTSYSTEATPSGSEYSTYYWGGVFIRRGYVQGIKYGIYSKTPHSSAVRIGSSLDSLTTSATVNINSGPTVRGSSSSNGRGVYISNTDYKYVLTNGISCGVYQASNVAPSSGRTNYSTTLATSGYGDYKCYKLKAS